MKLYKYCRSAHAESALLFGSVRLGTLSDYQKTDKYGEFVADSTEGTKQISGVVPELTSGNIGNYPGLKGIVSLSEGAKMSNFVFTKNVIGTPDLLIFSASTAYDPATHEKWRAEEGYDSCYRIHSAKRFFRALTEALGSDYGFLGFRHVVYSEDLHIADPKSAIHPAFVKRHCHHIEQVEVRAAWSKKIGETIPPLVLPESRAKLYVCLHSKLSNSAA